MSQGTKGTALHPIAAYTPYPRLSAHPALRRRPAELVQLAGDWRGGVPDHGTWIEQKHDGVRTAWIGGRLVTREGMEIGGAAHIAHRIRIIGAASGRPVFLDGEFIASDYRATLRHIGQGARAPEAGTLHLFDCLWADEWEADDCDRPLYDRRKMLEHLVAAGEAHPLSWEYRPGTHGREPDAPPLSLVATHWCADQGDVEAFTASVWASGGEGAMLKDAEAPYRRNRSRAWLKYKRAGWATRKQSTAVKGELGVGKS